MALDRIHLRKLLKLFLLKDNLRSTEIRGDARQVMKTQDEGSTPRGDFHAPFWRDTKDHATGRSDLRASTLMQIGRNKRRENLYPQLCDGFLLWWDEKRRWINEEISELPDSIKSHYGFKEIDGTVKVENLLSLKLGDHKHRYVYPYFSAAPVLTAEGARLGLWLMSQALPQFDVADMRILDVIRGDVFSVDRFPLTGNEEEMFSLRYRSILREWRSHFH